MPLHDDAPTPAEIEARIFGLLGQRRDGATICPSEVARSLAGNDGPWRALMPHVREVAHALVQVDRLQVTRGGVDVDALAGGGPIRLGRPASSKR